MRARVSEKRVRNECEKGKKKVGSEREREKWHEREMERERDGLRKKLRKVRALP